MLFYRIYFVFLSVFEFYYSLFARLSPDKFCYKSLLTFDFDNQIVYWLSRMWISDIPGIVFTCSMTEWFDICTAYEDVADSMKFQICHLIRFHLIKSILKYYTYVCDIEMSLIK